MAGDPYAFTLLNGPSGGNAGIVLGLAALLAPFKGGTYVPVPDVQITGLTLDASGSLVLAGTWPALPAGFEFFMQAWFVDPGAVAGWSSTSGLAVTLP